MKGETLSWVGIRLQLIYTAVFSFLFRGTFYFGLYSTSTGLQCIDSQTILHDSVQTFQMKFKPLVPQPLSCFHYELFLRRLMCLPAELIWSTNRHSYE